VGKEHGEWERKKDLLYNIHGVTRQQRTHNVHHIVPKSENGGNGWDNLSLLDKDLHKWIHRFPELIERNN